MSSHGAFRFGLAIYFLSMTPAAIAVDLPAEVAARERQFSDRCADIGIRDAFLEFFAPDAIHFVPEPKPARPDLEADKPDLGTKLAWRSSWVMVSGDGQLALSTGPFRLTLADGPEQSGWFFSVWRRDPQHRWQVAIDDGVSGPAIPLDVAPRLEQLTSTQPIPGASAKEIEEAGFKPKARYSDNATDETVYYRRGLGRALRSDQKIDLTLQITANSCLGGESAADLAYTYGILTWQQRDGKMLSGYYLHLWSWDGHKWILRVDLTRTKE